MTFDKPIGIFDSGVGGLTVLKEIHSLLPDESTIYLGDTARVPYGIRSPETVTKYSFENGSFLINRGIKLLVMACNTSSATSLKLLKDAFSIPVIGVIEPGAKASIACTKTKKVGVIGTETTIKSGAYKRAIQAINREIEIYEQACPLFVPLVEEGWLEDKITELIALKYLKRMMHHQIDTLVLGCTHYPLLKKAIRNVMDNGITLIDSAVATAKEVKNVLINSGILNSHKSEPMRKYYVTDYPDRFISMGQIFLPEPIHDIELIELTSLEASHEV